MEKNKSLELLQNKNAFAFEGGGVLGVAHAGALVRLYELGGLKNIDKVVGTSVGSIIATALACGASAVYIKNKLFNLNLERFKDGNNGISRLFNFIFRWGWYKGKEIERFAGEVLKDLTGDSDITFKEAYDKFKIHLTITYLSLKHRKTKYADHINTPNVKIKKAVKWSSTIPYFYEAHYKYSTGWNKQLLNIIVDGGVVDNYPLHVLHSQGCSKTNILGFKFIGNNRLNEYSINEPEKEYPLSRNIKDYSFVLLDIIREQALRYHVRNEDWKLTCKIDINNYKSTDFDITEEDKLYLYNAGRAAVDKYIKEIS